MPDGPHEIECAFNPTDYTLTQTVTRPRDADRGQARAASSSTAAPGALTFSTNLFFDAFSEAKGDVTPKITTLLSWMQPTNESSSNGRHSPAARPVQVGRQPAAGPACKGFITNATVKYTLFRIDGTPVRAEVAITITEPDADAPAGPEPDLARHQQPARPPGDRRRHAASRSRTGSWARPPYWRAIAELNDIDDPMRLVTRDRSS